MKPVRTLILLANEREARMLENEGVGKGIHQVRHLDRTQVSGDDIAYSDQPGRSQPGVGASHHGVEPSSSEVRQNRERFAADLTQVLGAAWAKGGYDRLVVSAPPKMLGALRDVRPASLTGALLGELDKDLLHTPVDALAEHFTDFAAF
jgi:protein required for attachment to host cells